MPQIREDEIHCVGGRCLAAHPEYVTRAEYRSPAKLTPWDVQWSRQRVRSAGQCAVHARSCYKVSAETHTTGPDSQVSAKTHTADPNAQQARTKHFAKPIRRTQHAEHPQVVSQ